MLNLLYRDHRISTDVNLMVKSMANIVEGALILPFMILYYTFRTWMDMTFLGPLCIYVFFIVSSLGTKLFMASVVKAVERLERTEADYRQGHASLIADAESIVFSMSEGNERIRLGHLFKNVLKKQAVLANRESMLEAVSKLFVYLGSILTYLILSFQFFSGAYDDLDSHSRATVISKVCIL